MLEMEPELRANRATTEARAVIFAALRMPVPDSDARKNLACFWKRIVQRHGWAAAMRACHVSRYHLGLCFAEMETNGHVWSMLGFYLSAGEALDAEAEAARGTNGTTVAK